MQGANSRLATPPGTRSLASSEARLEVELAARLEGGGGMSLGRDMVMSGEGDSRESGLAGREVRERAGLLLGAEGEVGQVFGELLLQVGRYSQLTSSLFPHYLS